MRDVIAAIPTDAHPALIGHGGSLSYADLAADALGLRSQVDRGGSAAVVDGDARLVAAAITALDGWAAEVHLLGDPDQPIPSHTVRLGAGHAVTSETIATSEVTEVDTSSPVHTRWRLYTSGTTGDPKPVDHDLVSLSRTVRPGPDRERRWGLLYPAGRMAGIQVVLQSLAGGATLVDATTVSGMAARLAMLVEHDVDSLSATPSVWRQVLQSPVASALPLRQITLGGEIADQMVLDALRRRFPSARITHVFASTETGAAFSVSDGAEGFPLSYLTEDRHGIDLEIRDDILHVRSPGTSESAADGYVSTGDIVQVVGDRVLFRGRGSGVVNVGGEKVWPEQVERTLRTHPEVAETIVAPRKNPLSGWMLTAAVVPAPDADPSSLPARLRAHCAEHLSAAHVPAIVRIVGSLDLADTGKMVRRG